jgi:hypothetical protein
LSRRSDKKDFILCNAEISISREHGIVHVNGLIHTGTNFEFSSGVGPIWNLTKDSRTLLDFTALNIELDQSTPITYNITMYITTTLPILTTMLLLVLKIKYNAFT